MNEIHSFLQAYRPRWEGSGTSDCEQTQRRADALTSLIADHSELAYSDISVAVWEFLSDD